MIMMKTILKQNKKQDNQKLWKQIPFSIVCHLSFNLICIQQRTSLIIRPLLKSQELTVQSKQNWFLYEKVFSSQVLITQWTKMIIKICKLNNLRGFSGFWLKLALSIQHKYFEYIMIALITFYTILVLFLLSFQDGVFNSSIYSEIIF